MKAKIALTGAAHNYFHRMNNETNNEHNSRETISDKYNTGAGSINTCKVTIYYFINVYFIYLWEKIIKKILCVHIYPFLIINQEATINYTITSTIL